MRRRKGEERLCKDGRCEKEGSTGEGGYGRRK